MKSLFQEAKAAIDQSFGVQAPQVIDVLERTILTTQAQLKGQPNAEATTQMIAASTVSAVTGIASLTDEQSKALQRYVAAYLSAQTVPPVLETDSIEHAAAAASRQGVELGVEQAFAAHRKRPASLAKIVASLIGFIAASTVIYLVTHAISGYRPAQEAETQQPTAHSERAPTASGLNRTVQKLVDEHYVQKGDHWYAMVDKRLIRYYKPKVETVSTAHSLTEADRLNGLSDRGFVSYDCNTFQKWDKEKKLWTDYEQYLGLPIISIRYWVIKGELRVSTKTDATPPPEEYLTQRLSGRNLKNIKESHDVVRGVWPAFWIQEPKLASYFIGNSRPATEGKNFKAAYFLDLENESRHRAAGIEAQVEWVIVPETTRVWPGTGQANAWETTRRLNFESFRPWRGDKGCEISSDAYWTVENLPHSHAMNSTELVWRFMAQKKDGRWTVTANDGTVFQGGVIQRAGKLGGAVRLSPDDLESLTRSVQPDYNGVRKKS